MKYYKAVKIIDGKMLSYAHLPLEFITEYHIEKWTFPNNKNTKLFCFNSFGAAKSWIEKDARFNNKKIEIWEVECGVIENPKPSICCVGGWSGISVKNLEDFWNNTLTEDAVDSRETPSGTVWTDKIKFLSLVKEYVPNSIE